MLLKKKARVHGFNYSPGGCMEPVYSFGAEVSGDGYALVGCTVAPGFDFTDFEMGNREELQKQFPEQTEIIERLTKSPLEVLTLEIP